MATFIKYYKENPCRIDCIKDEDGSYYVIVSYDGLSFLDRAGLSSEESVARVTEILIGLTRLERKHGVKQSLMPPAFFPEAQGLRQAHLG